MCKYNSVYSLGLLGKFLLSLNDAFQDSDVDEIVSILDHLSRTSRFSLSLQFLSQKEQKAVRKYILVLWQ